MMNLLKLVFKKRVTGFIVIFLLTFAGLNLYFLGKYRIGVMELDKVICTSNINAKDLCIYTKPYKDFDFDFKSPSEPAIEGNKFVFNLDNRTIRTFRIYFGRKIEKGFIGNIILIDQNNQEVVTTISEFETHGISILGESKKGSLQFSGESNSYLELKYERISHFEFFISELIMLFLGMVFSFLLAYVRRYFFADFTKTFNLKIVSVSLFLGSLFLPLPIFNITFMFSFLLVLKDFSSKQFIKNKAGLLFLFYFMVFLINNFFVSEEFNWSLTETLLPILFLPFYFACIPAFNYFRSIILSVFIICLFLIATSALDAGIYRNLNYFSFDAFSKYIHPIYFSYGLFFALVYIQLNPIENFNKKLFLPILFFALICCGSKLIIGLTVVFYLIHFTKKRPFFAYLTIAIAIAAILLFNPTRKRFLGVFDYKTLSVLNENPVPSANDSRLTGLTLRLIIWQESMRSINGLKEMVFGNGVDDAADKELEARLISRGLEKRVTKYDPHNQFIATYYKFGIIGLAILLGICIYYFYVSIKRKSELLFFSILLFSTAMLTESVLQRVVGIYFFICILLLLSVQLINSSQNFENSDTWNEGNSK